MFWFFLWMTHVVSFLKGQISIPLVNNITLMARLLHMKYLNGL